ncbi:MAG: RNA polymerase sigma factor [Dorea sp.]
MIIDKTWFSDKVHTHQEELYRLAFYIMKNKEDAEDVLQETLLRAYNHLEQLNNVKYFKTWITRILMNTAFEMQRKQKSNLNLDDYAEKVGISEDITTAVMMERAIQKLDEKYQQVIWLYYYEDYSIKEISEVLNVSIVNVKQRLSRSRKALKEVLSKREKGGRQNEKR